jgi:hypothetical protein
VVLAAVVFAHPAVAEDPPPWQLALAVVDASVTFTPGAAATLAPTVILAWHPFLPVQPLAAPLWLGAP